MLKTNNYLDKNYGEVKSVVALVQVDTANNKAVFHIGVSRDAILKGNIIETKVLRMIFPRNVNPYEYAYTKAKEKISFEKYDENGKKEIVEVDGIFTGWEDQKE